MALFIFRLLYCKFAIPQFNWKNLFFMRKTSLKNQVAGKKSIKNLDFV